MKSTGIVRRIDDLGRVTLPKELRTTMDLPEGTPMEIYVDRDSIVIRKYQPDVWSADELKNALVAAAKDAGHDPVAYLVMARKEAKS